MVTDSLGNELKEGMLVMISYNNAPTIARVVQLAPGGVIGNSRDKMPVAGMIVFNIVVPVQFQGDVVNGVWAVKTPSNQELAMQQAASENPS